MRRPLQEDPGAWGYWVRRRYIVEGGLIQPVTVSRLRIFDPFAPTMEWDDEGTLSVRQDGPAEDEPLSMALANAGVDPRGRVEAFCNWWGILGASPPDLGCPLQDRPESVADFVHASSRFHEVVGALADPFFDFAGEPALVLDEHTSRVNPVIFSARTGSAEVKGGSPPFTPSHAVYGGLSVAVQPGGLGVRWAFDTLLTAAYWQLWQFLEAGTPPRACDNPTCSRYYILTRPDRRFCSARCGNAVRQRERRAGTEKQETGGW